MLIQHFAAPIDYDEYDIPIFEDIYFTPKIDVWGVGVIISYLYTGTPLFTYRPAKHTETPSQKAVNDAKFELENLKKKEIRLTLPAKFRISTVLLL